MLGNFHFMWSIVAYCLSRVDKSNQWPGNTPGQPQWERGEGMVGVKSHTSENELLSFKPKSHMMGKQRSGTTVWQRLVSDFSLRTTTAFGSFWEGRELGKWIKRKIARGSGERSYSRGGEKEERDMAMDHRSFLVQGKFIGTLAQIHVICLAVHWSLGYISLPLQSVQLDKGQEAYQISSSQERVLSQVTYFKWNSQYQLWISPSMDKAVLVSHWQIQAYDGLELLKEKQPVIWQTVIVV